MISVQSMASSIELYDHQKEALGKLKSGAILAGDVGSGKTLTGLAFYLQEYPNKDIYIITTAKKRDTGDWEEEAELIGVQNITVDSWNNIQKYKQVKDAFFIFDEQRAVGYNAWGKALIYIARQNSWIMLSATPGDVWVDYIPVFVANGFYRNKTHFIDQHVEYDRFVKYPSIKKYHNTGKLLKLRKQILVPMSIERTTTRHRKYVKVNYDDKLFKMVMKDRWDIFNDKPIENVSQYTSILRRIVNTHEHRAWYAYYLMSVHDKLIIYYNYNYELDILKELCERETKPYAEWNGQRHEAIPDSEEWVYLVQYTAGAEGWNCIETNTMLFFSLNYSWRTTEQSEGRIDRLNTKFKDLEYFYLVSDSKIDRDIQKTLAKKKKFNASAWAKGVGKW